VDYSVEHLAASHHRLRDGQLLHLLENAFIYRAPVLNDKCFCSGLKQPLNLITIFSELARCEFATSTRTFKRKCYRLANVSDLGLGCKKIVLLTAPVLEFSCLANDLLNPRFEFFL